MNISVDIDTSGVSRWVREVFDDQLPFATSRAINTVALEFQRVQRQHMLSVFEVRRRKFIERSVKIRRGDFATKQRLEATVRIETPGGGRRDDIFTKFETGARKLPTRGAHIAIPQAAKRTRTGIIGRSQRPRAFKFKLHGTGPKATVFRGLKRTFMIFNRDGGGGIYQRVGRRRSASRSLRRRRSTSSRLRMLFVFRPEAPTPQILDFIDNAEKTVQRRWPKAFAESFDEAMRTARSPSLGVGRAARSLARGLVR